MKIGVVDTMFSRVDYFPFVEQALKDSGEAVSIERYTVPGIKDLPVACKKLFDEFGCDICIALGMPGPETVDKQCAHEASMGLQQVQLMCNKHVLEVFVHMDEAKDDNDLFVLCKDRSYKHTLNAIALVKGKTKLSLFAGKGKRQGRNDVGGVKID
jgi:riboflavin synthase